MLQKGQRVEVWLYEKTTTRMEGKLVVCEFAPSTVIFL